MSRTSQSCLINLIKAVDFIGIKPSLFIEGSRRFNTLFGGILCLLISGGIFCAFLFFSQDIVFRRYPTETTEIQISQYPKPILLSQEGDQDLGFALQIIDDSRSLILNDYFQVRMLINTVVNCGMSIQSNDANTTMYTDDENDIAFGEDIRSSICKDATLKENKYGIKTKTLEVKPISCDSLSTSYLYPNVNKQLQQAILCIPYDSNILLLGNEFFYLHQSFKIIVAQCESQLCPQDTNTIMNGAQVNLKLFYKNTNFNLKSQTPLLARPDKLTIPFSLNSSNKLTVELQNTQIQTDIGLIFEDFRSDSFVIKSSTTQTTNPAGSANGVEIEFVGSSTSSIVYRKYIKVQRILADVGGLYKTFVIMAIILNYFHNRAKYYEALFNNLFDINDLGKYFQYYDPSIRLPYMKIKDSIFLKTSDHGKFKAAAKINTQEFAKKSKSIKSINEVKSTTKNTKTSLINVSDNTFKKQRHSMSQQSVADMIHEDKGIDILNNVVINNDKEQECSSEHLNKMSKVSISLNSNQRILEETKSQQEKINEAKVEQDIEGAEKQIAEELESQENSQERLPEEVENFNEAVKFYIDNVKRDPKAKENFTSVCKNQTFYFSAHDLVKFMCCAKSNETIKKRSLLYGGKEMIEERMDIINLMKKNLEFERFKNLILNSNQLLLLDSLSKFMLDPERLKLTSVSNCGYEKFIDNYAEVFKSENQIDATLAKWVRTKYQLKF